MKNFEEWLKNESSFPEAEYNTMIAKAVVRELGGDPTSQIDITDIVSVGDVFKSAGELESALLKAIEFGKSQGAREKTLIKNLRKVRRASGDQTELVKIIGDLLSGGLMKIDDIERRKARPDWEKKRRPPRGPRHESTKED